MMTDKMQLLPNIESVIDQKTLNVAKISPQKTAKQVKHVHFSNHVELIGPKKKEKQKINTNEQYDEKIDQDTLASEETLRLLDKFIQIYNTKYNTSGSFFEGIDVKNPIATNDRMEMFYEYMKEHQNLLQENPAYVDVYEPGVAIENPDSNEVYSLITCKDSKQIYLSLSFISLLTIGIRMEDFNEEWTIIRL